MKTSKQYGFIFALALLLILSSCSHGKADQNKPNIIFLLTDDLGAWACGFNNPDFLTPQIDALAKDGVIFSNYYNTSAICMASRATIMTGMYEYKTGTNFMHGGMDRSRFNKSYPVILKNNGYFTGFVGKFGFLTPPGRTDDLPEGYEDYPVDRFSWWAGGLDQTSYQTKKNYYIKHYAEAYPHSSAANGAASVDFIREAQTKGKPFCLSVSFKAPHLPNQPDPQYAALFKDRVYSKPANYWRENGTHLPLQAKMGRQYLSPKRYGFYPENFQNKMRSYNQLVYGVDVAIGMIRDELKAQGIDKNTILIFTSDNGYFNGNHGLSCKVLPYEEASHSPLIIFDPRKPKVANTSNALLGNIDIAPSILDWAGLPKPDRMDGKSLRQLLESPSKPFRKSLALLNCWGPAAVHSMAVVSLDYKYIYWPYAEGMNPAEELYDRHADPYEMYNIAHNNSYPDKLNHYRDAYDQRLNLWRMAEISENGYEQFITIFNRNLPWSDKKAILESQFVDEMRPFREQFEKDSIHFKQEFGFRYPQVE